MVIFWVTVSNFFVSYLDAAEKLKPKERGEFLYAVAKYGITGEEIPLRKSLQPLWDVIKPNLEVSRKYQTYGEKGGRPQKPPFEKSESPLSENRKPNKEEEENKDKDMNVEKNTNTECSAAGAASEGVTQQDRQNILQSLRVKIQPSCKLLTITTPCGRRSARG